ncbi:MAG: hypothetical protein RBT87_03745 [bacterium]|nr:hypothetical protein [bacterium]
MRILVKTVFLFLLIIIFTSFVHPECFPEEVSYIKLVESRSLSESRYENELLIESLKNHLKCHPDKEVYYKLAVIYEYIGKHYLAGIAYKKAGKNNDYDRMQQIIISKKGAEKEKFKASADFEAAKYHKPYKTKKTAAMVFHITGPIAFATGLSLFIHDKAGGKNSLTAQYTLMFGGLSMIAGGTILNAHADEHLLLSNAYSSMSDDAGVDYGLTPDEYFASSGKRAGLYSGYSGKYMNRGLALIFISLPMIGFGIFSFFDTLNFLHEKHYEEDSNDSNSLDRSFEAFFSCLIQIAVFIPAISSIVIGARMMARGSKWGKQNTEPNLLTLNSIAPIIDPVSKTYGLALGFSF